MNLVITTLELKPDALTEFTTTFERDVPQVLGQYPSWRGAELSFDPGNGVACAVGYWADPDQMRDCLESPEHGAVMGKLMPLVAGAPDVKITEVVTHIGALAANPAGA